MKIIRDNDYLIRVYYEVNGVVHRDSEIKVEGTNIIDMLKYLSIKLTKTIEFGDNYIEIKSFLRGEGEEILRYTILKEFK